MDHITDFPSLTNLREKPLIGLLASMQSGLDVRDPLYQDHIGGVTKFHS